MRGMRPYSGRRAASVADTKSHFTYLNNKNFNNMDNQNQQGYPLEITPELALGLYSNFVMISHSTSDFILDFAQALPGLDRPKVGSRIVMAPEHAKRLLFALQDNIVRYEKEFGTINLAAPKQAEQPEGGRTIAPFGTGNGEA